MTTQTIRKERGFLDTRAVSEGRATRGAGSTRDFLREAGATLVGVFEAPLRWALGPRAHDALESLDRHTRRDIGL